jgi:hypothetical protein
MKTTPKLALNVKTLLWMACALAVVLSASGCGATAVRQPIDLVALHTNDVGGYLEPCG